MVPIVMKSNKEFDQESFRDYIINICKDHQKKNKALAFAFLVYDFEDHTILEILKKKEYWTALDKISGQFLSVFYLNSNDSYFKRRQREIYMEEKREQQSPIIPGLTQFLVPIKLRSTPLDQTIEFLRKEFRIEENISHPFVIFFQTDGESIIDYFVVVLKQEQLEKAFLELKRQIKNAVNSISEVTSDNFENHQEIFDLIRNGVEGGNLWEFINKKVISKISIGTIIAMTKIIAG
jgi:hypothetical protein